MMRKITYLILIIITIVSCDDDFLERSPLDRISSELVFEDENLIQAYLYNLQGRLPYGTNGPQQQWTSNGYGSWTDMLASATDESRAKSGWVAINRVIRGAITPSNDMGGLGLWVIAYETIRVANEIIVGVEGSSVLEAADKAKALAQARYVRAFEYYELARRYGDVPLITAPQSIDDDLLVSRTPRQDVYNFINTELSAIALILPNRSETELGEINKQAAIALNSRVMLYAEEWQKAADLADQIISGSDNDGIDLHPDYAELFLSHSGNNEVIMEQITNIPNAGHSFAFFNSPVRWRGNWGGQTDPTQQMVDAYEMAATGLPITDGASGYNPDRPYDGRDSRFYATIFYHGSEYSEIQPTHGEPFIDMEWNNFNEGPGEKLHGAASITGYLVKKFMNPADGFGPAAFQSSSSWKEIRFAEVLLNYAEGANEATGPSAEVYDAVNRVRARAGLPGLLPGLSQADMRDRIRQERRIELAFENHRWFDLIRWGIAQQVLDGFVPLGVKITRNANAPSQEEQPQWFEQDDLDFEYFNVAGRDQVFPATYDLLPIPQHELDKNPNLQQNPGY